MGRFADPYAEYVAVEAWRAAHTQAQTRAAAVTPREALSIAAAARMIPGGHPGTILALGKSLAATGPVAQMAAHAEAVARARAPGSGRPFGATVTGRQLAPGMWRDLTPGQRRLAADDTGRAAADPGNLRAMGVIDADGMIHRPARPRFDEDTGSYQFDDAGRQVANQAFLDLMAAVAAEEGTDTPIPFIDDTRDGQVGLYYPKTGNTGTLESDRSFVTDLPGGLDDRLRDVQAKVTDYLLSRRLPQVTPGLPEGGTTLQAGMGSPREVAQSTFAALDMPVQETQGLVRNVYAATRGEPVNWWEPQSDFLISATNPGLDMGGGFLVDPESEVARERRRRETERGLIDGHTVTLGRWAASAVVEPGTKPYSVLSGLVDLGVQIADPSAFALGNIDRAVDTSRVFTAADEAGEAAGLINSWRRSVHGPTADAWLSGPVGSRVVDEIAATSSPAEIWRRTNRKLDPDVLVTLAAADTPEAVRASLKPLLGTTFRTVGDVWTNPRGFLGVPRPSASTRRLLAQMPGRSIDTLDPQSAMRETELWLRNADVDDATIVGFLDRVARAQNRNDVYAVVTDVMAHTDGVLAKAGVNDPVARSELTRLWRDTHEDARHWFVDEAGAEIPVWREIAVDGEVIDGFGPHLSIEHLSRFIPLPDPRRVRALTSKYPTLLGHRLTTSSAGTLRWPVAALHGFESMIWKPFQLLRAAWPVRVIGEEQVRMAASGFDSMFRHPISFIAWVTGRKGGVDLAGNPFDEATDFGRAMTRHTGGWLDDATKPGRVRTGRRTVYRRTTHEMAEFVDAWSRQITNLYLDPVSRHLARSSTLDDAEEWFTKGAGRGVFDELVSAHPGLKEPGAARRYLETVQRRIDHMTGGNTDLLEAIRKGQIGKDTIFAEGRMAPAGSFRRALKDKYLTAAPEYVVGDDFVTLGEGGSITRGWRAATDYAFGQLMARPTNYLSRSPMFRQTYWKRVPELVGFGDETAKAAVLATLDEARSSGWIASRMYRRLERQVRNTKPGGTLNADEIDTLAKGYALDETKNLLYDLARKSQIMDAMRLVFPFGEAWAEVATRWAQLASPFTARGWRNLRRGQQIIEGARGEGFGEVIGAPEGEGFFFRDEWGEERFWYPFSSAFMAKVPGGPHMPIPLAGRTEGLSMFGTVLPGVGPVAGVPLSWLLPDKPGIRRELRDLLLPFGAIGGEGDEGSVTQLLNYAPPWLRRAYQAAAGGGYDPESDRLWGNSVMSMATYLMSTGRYDHSRADQQQLMEDAKEAARGLYLMRGLVGFGAPAAPAPDFVVESNDRLVRLAALRDEYYALRNDDYETADQKFLERYGEDLAAVMVPYTREIVPAVNPSRKFEDWRDRNRDLVARLPNTYAFFGPQPDDFNYTSYQAQFARGDREALTPDEWAKLVDDRLGWMLYRRALDRVGDRPTGEDRAWLRGIAEAIRGEYPGWKDIAGLEGKAPISVQVDELVAAVDDPAVARSDAGKGLALYLRARARAQEAAEAMGLASFTKADAARSDREWLRGIAAQIIDEHPDFGLLWDRVFSREMVEDED